MNDLPEPFFLLGAGFVADASGIVGPIEVESIYIGKYRLTCKYPLVSDLSRICFPKLSPAVPESDIEQQLAHELEAGNDSPVRLLCEEVAKADHYLAPPLVGWPTTPNPYSTFFEDFPGSSFATYNYDAFVEFALFRAGRWSPHDGYGISVATDMGFTAAPYTVKASQSLVLHLHGTYSVYSYDHQFGPPDKDGVQWMKILKEPQFAFDPYSLGSGFYPFQRFMAGLSYNSDALKRIIAPIPNKAVGLQRAFLRATMEKAKEIIRSQGHLVAIGYAFSPHDESSYSELLDALCHSLCPRMTLISPEARAIVGRLRHQYPKIEWVPVKRGFSAWVDAGYPEVLLR